MNHSFWVFAFASLMLNITPGNDMIYIVSRSTGQGVRAGVVSALGVMTGCLVHILAAVAGLSAIIARSAMAFQIIKYIGAAYLVYLGTRSLLSRERAFFQREESAEGLKVNSGRPEMNSAGLEVNSCRPEGRSVEPQESSVRPEGRLGRASGRLAPISQGKIFWQGVLTNVLNPKVALFFLAFLPQFIDIKAVHPQSQILFLGIWFDISGTLVNIGVAILFGRIGDWLSRSPRIIRVQEKITGLVLIALGIKVALTSKK
jgi:threonine/homoserine/homoserine lactone efflux protein